MNPLDFRQQPGSDLLNSSYQSRLLEDRAAAPGQRMRFLGFMLMIVFFLLPVYLRPSGGLQLVDIPIVILIILTFLGKHALDKPTFKYIISLLPFVIWVILINLLYFVVFSQSFNDYWYILSALIIIYGFLQLYTFTVIFSKLLNSHNIKYIYFALICSVIGCLSIKGYVEAQDIRPTLSFNNPNQLAYFAIVLMSYSTLLMPFDKGYNKNKIFIIFNIVLILSSHYFILLSISRAGILSLLILDFCLLLNLRNLKYLLTIGTVLLAGALLIFLLKPTFIQERLEVRSDVHYSPGELFKGHDGIMDRAIRPLKSLSGIEFLIGRGGGLMRELIELKKHKQIEDGDILEVHNTFIDVFKCYGIIGLLLFAYWFGNISWDSRLLKNGLLVMTAIIAFNTGHNGIRVRYLWIFIAFMIAMIKYNEENKRLTTNQQII